MAENNGKRIIELVEQIADVQSDFSVVLNQILNCLYHLALVQQIPGALEQEFNAEMINALAQRLSPEEVQLYYQLALIGQKDLDLAPNSRMGFEMLMLRMLAFKPLNSKAELKATLKPNHQAKTHETPSTQDAFPAAEKQDSRQENIVQDPGQQRSKDLEAEVNWTEMINRMRLESLTKELASNCSLDHIDAQTCRLILDESHRHLLSDARHKKLQVALHNYFQSPLKLTIKIGSPSKQTPAAQLVKEGEERQQAAVDAINSDANIQALKDHFAARIMPDTIEPV